MEVTVSLPLQMEERLWGALSRLLLCKEAYPVELIVTLTTSELLWEGPETQGISCMVEEKAGRGRTGTSRIIKKVVFHIPSWYPNMDNKHAEKTLTFAETL